MRSYRLVPVALLCAAALSACGKGGPGHGARSAGGPQQALNAGGEPQWSAQVRGGVLHFTAGEGAPLSVQTTLADHGRDGRVWTGDVAAAPGRPAGPIRLTALAKPCQDAETGMSYPLSAVVEVGGVRYGGCAAPPGQGLGPRT